MRFVKNMRIYKLVPALCATIFAAPALAAEQYMDSARVLSSTPQVERINVPREECRTEYQQQSYQNGGNNSVTGAIIGGIAGGLLGNTIGKGNGRVAAAAVGAGVGAIAGNNIANNQRGYSGTRSVPVQSCYQVDSWQTVNTGYLVTYEYNGRQYTTVTNEQPGHYIDINVVVEPRNRVVSQTQYVAPVVYGNSWDDDHHGRRGDRRYY